MIRVIGFVFEIVFELLSEIMTGIFEFISALFDQERKTEFDATFVPPHEIMR